MSEYENKQFEDTGFETPTTNAMVSERLNQQFGDF